MISNLRQNKNDEIILNLARIPMELQNKIFFYCAEHPCAKMIRKHIELSDEDEEK